MDAERTVREAIGMSRGTRIMLKAMLAVAAVLVLCAFAFCDAGGGLFWGLTAIAVSLFIIAAIVLLIMLCNTSRTTAALEKHGLLELAAKELEGKKQRMFGKRCIMTEHFVFNEYGNAAYIPYIVMVRTVNVSSYGVPVSVSYGLYSVDGRSCTGLTLPTNDLCGLGHEFAEALAERNPDILFNEGRHALKARTRRYKAALKGGLSPAETAKAALRD